MESLLSLDISHLTELARVATGDANLTIRSWALEPVLGGFGSALGGTAIFRVKLQTHSNQRLSLVLKILYARENEAPSSPYYWKREYEVYRSGLLDDMPPGSFSTPRIYDARDFGAACHIWMEDIQDSKGAWTLEDYRDIAQRLGRFNGAWLARRAPRDYDWLSRNWHSAIVPGLEDAFADLDKLLDSPLARRALPIEDKEEIAAIWRDRRLFQDALAQLPQTFCHTDAFRRNILHRGDQPVLLDWALASKGALGEDLVCLVAVSLYYGGFSAPYADQLDKTAFAGYVAGLRQAGWTGDAALARVGFTCGMALRGLAGVKQDLELLADQANHQQLTQTHGAKHVDEVARLFADVRRFRLLDMAREARALLAD